MKSSPERELLSPQVNTSGFSIKCTLLFPNCGFSNVSLSLTKFGGSSCSAQGSANHRLCWHFLLTRTNQIHPESNVHAAIEQLQNEHEAEFFGNDYGEIAYWCSMTASVYNTSRPVLSCSSSLCFISAGLFQISHEKCFDADYTNKTGFRIIQKKKLRIHFIFLLAFATQRTQEGTRFIHKKTLEPKKSIVCH